mmetsp:Transcript_5809/g.11864  ORF Transcript_5809/g.11864 Transcript_5809/m.11864 type:complete len:151 (-) Transcript_5809:351-803(-)|eukprot:CAMPEP_0118934918 /NCGR_PEP_ID=MMETSP1169-20130426/14493_1 /TAXON_ID=36882 /ORGANISM="Pyramimonas obovata, Strain CCMP722" /LENGTH=150 /DNA_ID=CAMNT_0006877881 /DNA_START=67 /DNA_END=519 /DNA_ORIENTATION=-
MMYNLSVRFRTRYQTNTHVVVPEGPRSGKQLQPTRTSSRASRLICRAQSAKEDIPPPDLRKLAEVARLEITDEEVAAWTPQFQQITEWFAQLQELDLDGVEPAIRAGLEENVFREDVPVAFEGWSELLGDVPTEGGYLKVPKVLGGSPEE